MTVIGEAFIAIRPESSAFAQQTQAQATAAGAVAGQQFGSEFSSGLGAADVSRFTDQVAADVGEAGEAAGQQLALDLGEAGEAAADSFGSEFSAGLDVGADDAAAAVAESFSDAGADAGEGFGSAFSAGVDPDVSGQSDTVVAAFSDAGDEAGEGFAGGFNRALVDVGIAAGAIALLRSSFAELEEAQVGLAQTQAVIRSTGGAANVTAEDIDRLTESLSETAAIDDDVIRRGTNLLLTFTAIRNEAGDGIPVFDRAAEALVDFATAKGVDVTAAAQLLGRALNAPERATSVLTRAGIILTEQQKEQIRVMTEAGDVAGAQAVILETLEERYGGSAEAGATGLARIRVAGGELAETIGTALAPAIEATADVLEAVPPGLQAITVGLLGVVALAPRISQTVDALTRLGNVSGVVGQLGSNIGALGALGGVLGPLGALVGVLGAVTLAADLFNDEQERAEETARAWTDALEDGNQALETTTANLLAARLEDAGLLDDLGRTGVSVALLTRALLGNEGAILAVGEAFDAAGEDGARLRDEYDRQRRGLEAAEAATLNFALTHGFAAEEILTLADQVGFSRSQLRDLELALADGGVEASEFVNQLGPMGALLDRLPSQTDLVAGSLDDTAVAAEGAGDGMEGFGEDAEQAASLAVSSSDAIDGLTAAIGRFFDEATRQIDAGVAFRESLRDIADTGREVAEENLTGQERLDAFLSSISGGVSDIDAFAQGLVEQGAATIDVVAQTQRMVDELFDAADQAGLTAAEVAFLQAQYGLLPEQVATEIVTNAAQVGADLDELNAKLDAFGGRTLDLQLDDRIFGGPRAAGGQVFAGKAYWWQETGAPGELFVPSIDGTVVPSDRTAGLATREDLAMFASMLAGAGGNVNVNVAGDPASPKTLALWRREAAVLFDQLQHERQAVFR